MDSAIKFQDNIPGLEIKCLDEYQKIINKYQNGIFISNMADCKTRKYSLEERCQGCCSTVKLSNKRYLEMEDSYPFYLYAIDTLHRAFARLKVIKVYLKKQDIPNDKLQLIPPKLQQLYAYAYYEFIELKILPYEVSNSVVNVNTGKPVFEAKQINANAPWYVKCIEGSLGKYLIDNTPMIKEDNILGSYEKYCVYRYYLSLPNCTMSYIGMSKDVQIRYNHHKNPSSWESKNESNKLLYLAFKNPTIGYDKFQFEILHDNLTEEEAHFWEAKEIQNFNSYYPFGFNVRREDKYLDKSRYPIA